MDPVVLLRQLQGLLIPVTGVPTDPPRADRAIAIDMTGTAGSILYVWDGSTWTAFA